MSAPWSTVRPMGVLGTGSAVPGDPVTTEALIDLFARQFAFRKERVARTIAERMGIAARHFARPFAAAQELPRDGQSNAELAALSVHRALADAGVAICDVGYLIAHTTTPGRLLPGNVADVADLLGYAGPHIELRQACTGFANALMIASGLLAASDRPVVIVGSETGSLFFDPTRAEADAGQLVNMVQMGDGAGAIVLGPAAHAGARIDAAWFGAIGLGRSPGISLAQGDREFTHDFAEIRATGHALFDAGRDAAFALRHDLASADWVIPHQVSGRIGALVADRYGLPQGRMVVQADRIGNTGSAAVWLALDAVRHGIAAPGQSALILGAEASKHMYGGFAYAHG